MAIVRLQHVQLSIPAGRAGDARRFYGEILGLVEVPRPQSLSDAGRAGIWYAIGDGQELHLFLNPNGVDDAARSSRHLAFIVDNLDGLRARIAGAGLDLEDAIPIAGRARFFARDPGGNRIEFPAFTADK